MKEGDFQNLHRSWECTPSHGALGLLKELEAKQGVTFRQIEGARSFTQTVMLMSADCSGKSCHRSNNEKPADAGFVLGSLLLGRGLGRGLSFLTFARGALSSTSDKRGNDAAKANGA